MKKILLNSIQAVLFDLDGTVYYGSKIIPGANDTINYFRENQKRVFFTTNNSTKTRQQIFEKLINMGVDCKYEEVLTSGYLAAQYAKTKKLNNIYIFGSQNLVREFQQLGVTIAPESSAQNLFIGYNPEMTYEGLTEALQVGLRAKQIIACNMERMFPGEGAKLMPGCGAMTAPIEWCLNRKCDVVIGKPSTFLIDYLVDNYGFDYHHIIVIGDTYESDIAMAKNAHSMAILIGKNDTRDVLSVNSIAEVNTVIEE